MIRAGVLRSVILFALLGFAAANGAAAPGDYAGKPVQAIEFDPEAQPYPASYLLEILPVKVGRVLALTDVRAAIQRLFATGRYADIHVDARMSGGGVILRFITRNNYFIGRIRVRGISPPPPEGVLVNSSHMELGTLFTPEAARQAVTSMRTILENNGFFNSSVEPQFYYDPDTQQVNITFIARTSRRARYSLPNVTGEPGRPARDIVKITHWKGWFGWKTVTEARSQDGVQRVRRSYQKQDRLEAKVALQKMDYDPDTNRVTPTLNAIAGPRIQISTIGAKISRGKLKQLVPVFEEQSVDRDLLVEGANNIRNYLETKGFFHSKVSFFTRPSGGQGQEEIDYRIQRGERDKVVLVSIQGNKYFDTNTIRERMYVRPASFIQFRYGRYSDAYLRRDVDAITALYLSNGFRDVEVTSRVEHGYRGREREIAVFFTILEGPQTLVANLDLAGVSPANRAGVENVIESQAGQPFSESTVAVDRDNILDYYYNHGYARASFSWSLSQGPAPNRVNLKYTIEEGSQHFLRRYLITGLDTTRPGLVEERLSLSPGDPLSRSSLLDSQRRLYDLGIFASVDMALQNPGAQERDKYVDLDLEEATKYTITTGFGAEIAKIGGCQAQTCLEAPAGQAGFSPRALFGVTRRNFLGLGHIISFQSRVSTLQQRAVLTYQAPQFQGNPNIHLLFSGLFDDSHDIRTFTSRRREGSVQLGQRVSKASTFLYRFSYRRVGASDLKIGAELLPIYSQPARIGMASLNYIQDRRDDPTDSHRGIYNTLEAGLAGKYFGSQADFTRFVGHNATYHPFGFGNRYVLARSLSFGWIQPMRAGEAIPLPETFFAGGATSHRGFPENQAGPRDPFTGFPIGGKALLINQVEIRYPLLGENLTGVIFEDAGNVYSRVQNISLRVSQNGVKDFDYMVHAAGFGIRYRTPVGPVRIDLGYAFNPPQFYGFTGSFNDLLICSAPNATTPCKQKVQQLSHFQFHFSLGQAF